MAEALSGSMHTTAAKDVCRGLPFLNYTFDWGAERPKSDKWCQYGAPPASNANFVLANGSMSSNQSGEGDIRRAAHPNPWHN